MEDLNIANYYIKTFFLLFFSCYILRKILNKKEINKKILDIIILAFISIIITYVRKKQDNFYCVIIELSLLSILNIFKYEKPISITVIDTVISLGISYIFLLISILLSALPNRIFAVENDYYNLIIIVLIYSFTVWSFLKIKRVKNGLAFLQNKLKDENLDIILLNISMIVLVIVMIMPKTDKLYHHATLIAIIFIPAMCITIKKCLDSYYKYTLLIKDLKETKEELKAKNEEIGKLENEILNFSEKSHSLAHKQRKLEKQIEYIITNGTEGIENLKSEIDELSKEVYKKQAKMKLDKTGIQNVDDMLNAMQADAMAKNIDFELQICGNIHHLVNHYISKENLEILLADHIKDAIIAIDSSNNINRTILVKIGKIDENYGIYIYDSGIEFEEEVLKNLGKKPITTHKENGGTGMGFMNTFKVLKEIKASLEIHELGQPSKEKFTKIVMIKFDNKNEFKVKTYKKERNKIVVHA